MGAWGTGLYSGDFAMDLRTALEWQIRRPTQDCNDEPARRHFEVVAIFDTVMVALESLRADSEASAGCK